MSNQSVLELMETLAKHVATCVLCKGYGPNLEYSVDPTCVEGRGLQIALNDETEEEAV